jgi:hypothetical protein
MDLRHLWLLGALGAAACGGSSAGAPPLAPPPDRATRATLVGPLCADGQCRCRSEDDADEVGTPEAGKKRYEIRLGPADHELWASLDDMVLYKDRERATACFYVDLAPGVHPMRVRGVDESPLGFQVQVAEQGGDGERLWWYDTFAAACGAPGPCDKAALDEVLAGVRGKKGKLDACGSTKIKEVAWHTGRAPDVGGLTDVELRLALQIYGFAPSHPPGDPACLDGAR